MSSWDLGHGASIDLYEGYLSEEMALRLFKDLQALPQWTQRTIRIYGKEVKEPRQTIWVGDPGTTYRYSGRVNHPEPWSDSLQKIRTMVEETTAQRFNSCLLNLYRTGQDSISPHADDEPELGPTPTIASLSLGASRKFTVRPKTEGISLDLTLTSGSLVVMRGTMQQHYKHAVPKQARVHEPRINITFRLTGRS